MANRSASDIAGRRIREARQRRGWTARELASRCAAAGAPRVTPTVVTNLETRRRASREITLDEVLVLARVLDVPPLQLMIPAEPGERLQVLPCDVMDAAEVVRWIGADTHVALTHAMVSMVRDKTAWIAAVPVTVVDMVRQVETAVNEITARYGQGEGDDPGRGRHLALIADRLMYVAGRLEELGYEAPGLDRAGEILKRYGLPSTVREWRDRANEGVPGGKS